ncbi:hypothetical protein PT015_10620 [Candidatus Mycobacterium wuenschmannii]|uniref:Uncharacterized protein n=1 Tax=Candidatus Mycobacterium wuenschmannii TaxID=3027808 RepID=A0ABY8W1V1_9MYCO|nr:hypothetical protein [Candidatus Mycobacterium wuenschmannii]WIM89833.1 hypothetical protein PT015_10620 [Candidatus Mycobacterium wuenschmannii]
MIQTGSASYEEMLADFTESLNCALAGTTPAIDSTLSPTLLLSLADIAAAVRDKRPTHNLVTLACAAFTVYATDRGAGRHGPTRRNLRHANGNVRTSLNTLSSSG